MQLFSSFGISFLHFSALTIWQFNFTFSVLHYYISVFSIQKKNANRCNSLCAILEKQNIWTEELPPPRALQGHHITFLRFLLEKFYLLSAPCQGWDRWYQNCSWLALISFEIKKEIMETISNMCFPNLTVNLCMGLTKAGFPPHPMCIGWGNWLGLTATPFPLCFHHFWAFQKQGFAIIKQES